MLCSTCVLLCATLVFSLCALVFALRVRCKFCSSSAAMDSFGSSFSFWDGLSSLSEQPKTPDLFEAPWEASGFLARMGEAEFVTLLVPAPIETSSVVVKAVLDEQRSNAEG